MLIIIFSDSFELSENNITMIFNDSFCGCSILGWKSQSLKTKKNVVPLSNFHYFHWEVSSQLVDLLLSAFRILFDVLHFYNESSAKFFSLTLCDIHCILSYYYFFSITAFNIFHVHASFLNILRISSDLPLWFQTVCSFVS